MGGVIGRLADQLSSVDSLFDILSVAFARIITTFVAFLALAAMLPFAGSCFPRVRAYIPRISLLATFAKLSVPHVITLALLSFAIATLADLNWSFTLSIPNCRNSQ